MGGLDHGPVLELLANFGLKRVDAYVYVFLAKEGPCKGKKLCSTLGLTKQQLYLSLSRLQEKGIVKASSQWPALFSALPFEQVLDLSVKSKINEAQTIQQNKQDLLVLWRAMTANNHKISPTK